MRAVANPHELLDAEIIRARATITDADLAAQRPLIVVVGGRASNYPRWMHADPRIAIWTDMTNRTPTLPATTCVVVSSPFVSHAQSRAVETSAFHKPGCYYFKHPRTLAEIRRIVQVLLDVAIPDDDTAYEPAPRPMNAPRLTIVDAPARDRVAPNALQRVDPPAVDPVVGETRPETATPKTPTTSTVASDDIDAAIGMVGEAMAALSMVNETLQRARAAAQKVEDTRAMLKRALEQIGG
jgi:hypothetical protein